MAAVSKRSDTLETRELRMRLVEAYKDHLFRSSDVPFSQIPMVIFYKLFPGMLDEDWRKRSMIGNMVS